jgi:hypothetical protein
LADFAYNFFLLCHEVKQKKPNIDDLTTKWQGFAGVVHSKVGQFFCSSRYFSRKKYFFRPQEHNQKTKENV